MPGEFTCLCLPVMVFNPLLFAVGFLRREECNECGNLEFPGQREEVCARDSRDWWQNVQLAKMLFLCLHISSVVAVAAHHYSRSTALAVSAGRGCPEGEWCCLLVLFGVLMYLCAFIMDDVLIFGPLWTLQADFVCGTHLSLRWSLQSTRNQVQRARGFCVWECLRRD